MLSCLRVRSFAIIDELEVELSPGMNVVTGETGAGKSILVDALGLVLGARGRPEIVRTGEKQAEVEALFDIGDDPAVAERLQAAGLEANGELLVRRLIQANGRTRAYVNGRMATRDQLQHLAAGLTDISSQHEHHTLVDSSTHLGYLDAFGQLSEEREAMAEAHDALVEATEQLQALDQRARDKTEREDMLRFQIGEIDELSPRPGEKEELIAERDRLRHAERLAHVAGSAEETLYSSDEAVSDTVARVASEVRDAARIDPRLEPPASQLDDARAQIEDAARELGAYARDVTVDPDRLGEVEDRLERLGRLERKHGGSIEAVLEHRDNAARELEELDRHEEHLEQAQKRRDEALQRARDTAHTLSKRRRAAAEELGKAITRELGSLGMGEAEVVVEVERKPGDSGRANKRAETDTANSALEVDGARLSRSGIDRAELLIAPNRGEQARPLRKIASGGELSRAMLAIKRVLAGLGPAGLYVFDEVDAGVGGAVAEVIGRKLREVSQHHQVLCITHLPQIGVYGDAHFRVHKEVVDDRTRSEIRRLDDDERLEEVARMLGGLRVTSNTRATAAEMLREAARA